jgi:hypothetical protein
MTVQYQVLDTNPPRKKFYFWPLWLFFLIYTFGLQADWLALPLDEGYLAHFSFLSPTMIIIMPLLWWLKWLIWRTTHIYNNSHLLECIAQWLVWLCLSSWFILFGLYTLYQNVSETTTTLVTDQYYVDEISHCSAKGGCSHGYYLLLEQAPDQEYPINKSTYRWLQEHYYPKQHELADEYKEITLTYKPEAKVVFNIIPYSPKNTDPE